MSKTPKDILRDYKNGGLPIAKAEEAISQLLTEARIQSLQWALNDYNMPDTDTEKNLEGFIADLEEKQSTLKRKDT